ncbi:MAG: aldehyde dehydrogenase family protein [Lewinellaceae bacterium]|nr:aldehyde dehydrogenase family protein [Lewinellaceae bacterium]
MTVSPPLTPAATTTDIATLFERQMQHQQVVAATTARQRIANLWRLHDTMLDQRGAIKEALWSDFKKSPVEVDISEIGVINSEIRHTIRNLESWMTPRRVGTPMVLIGTRSEIRYEPKGVCLILSPWNYPVNLTFVPLVSAIAAGNCAILKPSENAPASAAVMKKIVEAIFPPEEVVLLEGDASLANALLQLPFHHIFFTGGPSIGKVVMKAAAAHLTSVTLELGGKSPVIVDETADLSLAASRAIWIKGMNGGQTCIASDYILVQESVADKLVAEMSRWIQQLYGETSEQRSHNTDFCRIINDRHFDRIQALKDDALAKGATLSFGGHTDAAQRLIDLTLLTDVPADANIWEEEIFGPILPIRTFKTLEEAIAIVNAGERPLAMYLFSGKKKNIRKVLSETRSGGVSVNDCGVHFYNPNLPFGGVNNSGHGKCHGEFGFLEFSNQRGVTYQNTLFPFTRLFMPPYGSKLSRWILEGILRYF